MGAEFAISLIILHHIQVSSRSGNTKHLMSSAIKHFKMETVSYPIGTADTYPLQQCHAPTDYLRTARKMA